MCDPVTLAVTAAVVTAGGQLYQGAAANAQGKYQSQIAEQNAVLERNKVADAKERGNIEQARRYRELAQSQGRARAAMGAAGLDLGFGSALGVQLDQAAIAAEDASLISSNMTKEIEGYDINAANYVMEGRAARSRGKAALVGSAFSAAGTLLGGAQQARGYSAAAKANGSSNSAAPKLGYDLTGF